MQVQEDKERLLALMQVEYEFVHRTIDQLSPEEMQIADVQGLWSVKDTLAHLTAWMKRLHGYYEAIRQERSPQVPQEGYSWKDIDTINDAQFAIDQHRELDDILSEFHEVFQQTYSLVERLDEDELFHGTYGGLIREPMWRLVIGCTYHHFYEHIQPIRKWMMERASA